MWSACRKFRLLAGTDKFARPYKGGSKNWEMLLIEINPLTPNGLYSGRAAILLNSRTAIRVVANRVSKFGGNCFHSYSINFSGLLFRCTHEGQAFIQASNCTPLISLTPSHTTIYTPSLSKCAFLHDDLIRCWHHVLWLSLALLFSVGLNINTGLWNKNSFVTRMVVSGILYPIYFREM
jgi:hypothetical protein